MKEAEINELKINTNEVSDSRITGKIIHLNPKGFGFINSESKPFTRIFFHWQSLHYTIQFTSLKEDDEVSFELKKNDDGGYRAIKVDLVHND